MQTMSQLRHRRKKRKPSLEEEDNQVLGQDSAANEDPEYIALLKELEEEHADDGPTPRLGV